MKKSLSLAIIGGGISGLSLAACLMKHPSLKVTLIEK
jgi:2-polyprenyl-6-methoxyphenol hydroxylase-like FAD-dependent oxidoreductase